MNDPLSVHILSSSGAGKSYLQDAVLSLCPEEDLIKLTSLTGQALFYKGEDSLRHKCLCIEEIAGAEGARYAVRNLISAKKLTIEATIKNPLSGKMETQTNTVYGPTAVFETTTRPDTVSPTLCSAMYSSMLVGISCFMLSLIWRLAVSTASTWACTTWPTCSASDG